MSEAVQMVAVFLTGFVVAVVVQLLRWSIAMVENGRLALLYYLLGATLDGSAPDLGAAFAWYLLSSALLACAAVGVALRVTHTKGSGLPSLIAYLNGIKLRGFTSVRVLVAKFIATVLAVSSGLCLGPEGPIIHMGGCVGKQALRALYYLDSVTCFSGLQELRSDLDKVNFVALGAGAGVAAAFSAPISGTLFVVEEACSFFSLPLLWRAFSAAMVATRLGLGLGSHLLIATTRTLP